MQSYIICVFIVLGIFIGMENPKEKEGFEKKHILCLVAAPLCLGGIIGAHIKKEKEARNE